MEELTLEQQRALALARARVRAAQGQGQGPAAAGSEGGSEPSQPRFERAGGHGPFAAGMAESAIKGALGIKQFFGGLSPEEQAILAEIKAEGEADPNKGWRLAGNLTSDVAMTAAPGVGWGAKAALPRLAKAIAARSGKVAGAIGAGAATSGLTGLVLNPGEGETFGDQMASKAKKAVEDAGYGAGFATVGRVLKKTMEGLKRTPDAQKLLDAGVTPTVQQGAEGDLVRFISGLSAGAFPVKDRQQAEMLDAAEKIVSGGRMSHPGGTLNERIEALRGLFDQDYLGVFGTKRFPLSTKTRADVAQVGADVMTPTGQFVDEAQQASRKIANVMGDATNTISVRSEKMQKNYLSELARLAVEEDNPRVAEALRNAREVLIQKMRNVRLSQQELDLLGLIDKKYTDFSRLREVAKRSGEKEGLSWAEAANAYANRPGSADTGMVEDLLGPATRVLGKTPLQYQARGLGTALKRSVPLLAGAGGLLAAGAPAAGVASIAAPLYALSLASQTAPGARIMFGQTDAQREMAKWLSKVAPNLASAGYTLSPED